MNLSFTHAVHGLKTGCAAVLAYALTTLLNLDFGYWAVITTVIVMQVYVADSIEMCLYRFSGTILGALLGVLVLLAVPRNHIVICIALFITIGFCSFLTRYKARYRMAAITVVIVVMTGMNTENVFLFGFSRVLEILIGVLCAFLVSVLIFPRRGADVLAERLEEQAETCLEKSCILVEAFSEKQRKVSETLVDDLVEDARVNHSILERVSRSEAKIYLKNFAGDFAGKVSIMSRSAEHLRNMVRSLNAMDGEGYEIIMSEELSSLARKSGEVLILMMKGTPMAEAVQNLEKEIHTVNEGLSSLREKGLVRRFDSERLVQVFSFYSSLVYYAEDIHSAARTDSFS